MKKEIFEFIKNDSTVLEKEPFEKLTKIKNYMLTGILNFGNVWTL